MTSGFGGSGDPITGGIPCAFVLGLIADDSMLFFGPFRALIRDTSSSGEALMGPQAAPFADLLCRSLPLAEGLPSPPRETALEERATPSRPTFRAPS